LIIFIIGLLFAFFLGTTNWQIQFYGVVGRGTGLITYLCLSFIFAASAILSSDQFAKYLVNALIYSGYIAVVFGMIQFFGFDPIPWENPNNAVITMFGNPNFASAHLGMCAVAMLPLILQRQKFSFSLVSQFLFMIFALFICTVSDSSQGLLLIALISPLIIYRRFLHLTNKKLIKFAFFIFYLILLLAGFLAFFNRGILSSIIYQTSFQHRRDMWTTALTMVKSNPLHGVGLDSYGYWYRTYRSSENVDRWGLGTVSDSAHNVFLDFAANGGIALLAGYLIIIIAVFFSGLRMLSVKREISKYEASIIFGALAYLVQSFFSINQLGIAIWGWVFGGFILGRKIKNYKTETIENNSRLWEMREDSKPLKLSLVGICVGLLIGFPLAKKDAQFRDALISGDGDALEKIISAFPLNTESFVVAGKAYELSGIDDFALKTSLSAVDFNERDFDSWLMIFENPISTESQKNRAKAKIAELDPLFEIK
jgi:O-antigen ligase